MKFLIFFSCALAFASAGYPYYYAPQHIPLIDHNGVPVETPEVQAAKALHFAAHAAASHGTPLVYTGHHGAPTVGADGRPFDTPEVQLAKAAHFIAYNEAAIRNSYGGHYAAVAAGPIDTPEVQVAKAEHFAAHAEAKARGHYRKRRQAYYGHYAQPAIGPNGVPLDTPEVQAEKAKHFAALAQAQTRNNAIAPQDHSYSGPTYHGQYGYHIPVIGPNGVPVETPEVQAEKAKHFAAHGGGAPAPAYGGYQGSYNGPYATLGPNGPQDTPEVAAAKAAHLAAHARHY